MLEKNIDTGFGEVEDPSKRLYPRGERILTSEHRKGKKEFHEK